MICDECKKNQATVRLVALIDGNRTERNLCSACMLRQKLQIRTDGAQSVQSAMWSGANKTTVRHPNLRCPRCGMSYDEYAKAERVGCAYCYEEFRAPMRTTLQRVHGRAQHIGRVPACVDDLVRMKSRVEQLRREMDVAVACEDFEQAASLRDEIRALGTPTACGAEKKG